MIATRCGLKRQMKTGTNSPRVFAFLALQPIASHIGIDRFALFHSSVVINAVLRRLI